MNPTELQLEALEGETTSVVDRLKKIPNHNNEEICAEMAVAAMREAGYSEDDCTIVEDGIIATKVEKDVDGVLRQRSAPKMEYTGCNSITI